MKKITILCFIIFCITFSIFAEGTMIIPMPIPINTSNETKAYYFDEDNKMCIKSTSAFENVQDITKHIIEGRVVFIHNNSNITKDEIIEAFKKDDRDTWLLAVGIVLGVILAIVIAFVFMNWYVNR